MGNKLSELSKPVAYKFDRGVMGPGDFKYGTPQMHSAAKDENASPLYSQEYVSALLSSLEFEKQNNAGVAGMVEDYETKLEAKDKRIAELEGQLQSGFTPEALAQEERAENAEQRVGELEAIRSDASQVFKEIGNELGCNPDNESIMMAIDELKEREKRVVALANGNDELWDAMAHRLKTLEAKLATPVRLTDERTLWAGEDDYDTGHVKGWNANRIEQAALLKKQGFTVEGDE